MTRASISEVVAASIPEGGIDMCAGGPHGRQDHPSAYFWLERLLASRSA
ncbi:MAG: hypothetical protein ACLUNV_00015 [Sutterella wadsworthensis]